MKSALQVKPIILHHRPVVSLDTGGREGGPIMDQEFEAPLPRTIDLSLLTETIGLRGTEERAFALARYGDGLRGRALAESLGWSDLHVEAVRKRVARRLRNFDRDAFTPADFITFGDSLHLAFREELKPGLRCYALAELGPEFPVVMAEERRFARGNSHAHNKTFAA